LESVELLLTEQDTSCPQLTVEMDGAVIVRVSAADDEDLPGGRPVIVMV